MKKRYLQKSAGEMFFLFLFGIPYLYWIYSIGLELNKNTNSQKRIKPIYFQILLGYATLYLPIGMFILISNSIGFEKIIPFHITAMGCIFLAMILATISILRFEKSNNLESSSGIGLFFGIWYYIFGIWSIQPKLNKYINLKNNS